MNLFLASKTSRVTSSVRTLRRTEFTLKSLAGSIHKMNRSVTITFWKWQKRLITISHKNTYRKVRSSLISKSLMHSIAHMSRLLTLKLGAILMIWVGDGHKLKRYISSWGRKRKKYKGRTKSTRKTSILCMKCQLKNKTAYWEACPKRLLPRKALIANRRLPWTCLSCL